MIYKLEFRYDEKGNITEDIKHEFDSEGNIEYEKICKYKFDNRYNWVKKTIFENDIPRYVVERKIDYYTAY